MKYSFLALFVLLRVGLGSLIVQVSSRLATVAVAMSSSVVLEQTERCPDVLNKFADDRCTLVHGLSSLTNCRRVDPSEKFIESPTDGWVFTVSGDRILVEQTPRRFYVNLDRAYFFKLRPLESLRVSNGQESHLLHVVDQEPARDTPGGIHLAHTKNLWGATRSQRQPEKRNQ